MPHFSVFIEGVYANLECLRNEGIDVWLQADAMTNPCPALGKVLFCYTRKSTPLTVYLWVPPPAAPFPCNSLTSSPSANLFNCTWMCIFSALLNDIFTFLNYYLLSALLCVSHIQAVPKPVLFPCFLLSTHIIITQIPTLSPICLPCSLVSRLPFPSSTFDTSCFYT